MSAGERREQLIAVARSLFGKEGLYAVSVDRELGTISSTITAALESSDSSSMTVELAALALLTYIEDRPDGFRILSAGNDRAAGTYQTLLADVAIQVSGILASRFEARGIDPRTAPLYAQMLVGIVAMPAQWWLENRSNLAWNGLRSLSGAPELRSAAAPAPAGGQAARHHHIPRRKSATNQQ